MRVIPYGRHEIDEADIEAVVKALRSGWLTTGPAVESFERAFADRIGASHAVAVCNGTAALHLAALALDLGPGDEVIVTPMTFAATANAIVYTGATPVFADVRAEDLLIDPAAVEAAITKRTKAIFAVDYAGHPCDWDALKRIAEEHDLMLVDDAAHAVGATYKGRPVGTLADLTAFSFHPVKHITTGEGGMVTTEFDAQADRARMLRNHGITVDYRQREAAASWYYEIEELGHNFRITDFQCALGESQLDNLGHWLVRRGEIAATYDAALESIDGVEPLAVSPDVDHAYHLYVVRLADGIDRTRVFQLMREGGIGVNVHYIPVHMHPFYRREFGTDPGTCPVAEAEYEQIISLPMFPALTEDDLATVLAVLRSAIEDAQPPSART